MFELDITAQAPDFYKRAPQVYLCIEIATGRPYVGRSMRGVRKAISDHHSKAKQGCAREFRTALRDKGINNFIWFTLKDCSNFAELCSEEHRAVQTLRTLSGKSGHFGFNLINVSHSEHGPSPVPIDLKKIAAQSMPRSFLINEQFLAEDPNALARYCGVSVELVKLQARNQYFQLNGYRVRRVKWVS
jgi:hypothetical protein